MVVDQLFFGVTGHVCQCRIHIHHQPLLVRDQNRFGRSLKHPGEDGLLLRGQSLLLQHALQGIGDLGNLITVVVNERLITPTLYRIGGQLYQLIEPASGAF